MTWDARFLGLAEHIASWSRDPSTKVGAVIVDDKHRIVSLGFNGFPRGVADDGRLDDRETKYAMIVHAEANALLFARRSVEGCAVYTWPLPPCSRCAALLAQAGVARVVSPPAPDRWRESCDRGAAMLAEAGVTCEAVTVETAAREEPRPKAWLIEIPGFIRYFVHREQDRKAAGTRYPNAVVTPLYAEPGQ